MEQLKGSHGVNDGHKSYDALPRDAALNGIPCGLLMVKSSHKKLNKNEAGQAMTEYVIVVMVTVLVGFGAFSAPMLLALNDLYNQIVTIVNLPIP